MRALVGLSSIVGLAITVPAAWAQSLTSRTWVASTGHDSAPCTRVQPCLSLARALLATKTGGEVDVVDSGDYGSVFIDRSVTIRAVGVVAGVSSTGRLAAITIDCSDPNCHVELDGLSVHGTSVDREGIFDEKAGTVRINDTDISDFPLRGIYFQPSNVGSKLVISGSSISGQGDRGLFVDARVAGSVVTVRRSSFEDNYSGIAVSAYATARSVVNISDSLIADNTAFGVETAGAGGATVRLNANDITGNGNTGIIVPRTSTPGDQIQSFGNNNISGNGIDGQLTGTLSLRSAAV